MILQINYVDVDVKGGGGGRAAHRNLTVACIPRVGILIGHHAFYLLILKNRRQVSNLFLLILTILFHPGLDTDRCIPLFGLCPLLSPLSNKPFQA